MPPVATAMKIATGLGPKACDRRGMMRPASRMPSGPVAAFSPMMSELTPQDSILSASSGKASPSEMVKTHTAAQAATTLRRLKFSRDSPTAQLLPA